MLGHCKRSDDRGKEAHILDAGRLLLETHAAAALPLMLDLIKRTQRKMPLGMPARAAGVY